MRDTLRVRTQLRAGDCNWIDTNCLAVDASGRPLLNPDGTEVFNTCLHGSLASGGDCNEALWFLKQKHGITGSCQRC
jgi:hypothetical protein